MRRETERVFLMFLFSAMSSIIQKLKNIDNIGISFYLGPQKSGNRIHHFRNTTRSHCYCRVYGFTIPSRPKSPQPPKSYASVA